MRDACDVAIVGAGPGGSAAGHYLAERGLEVVLLDKSEFPRDKTCGDGLTPCAVSILREMKVLDDIAQAGTQISGVEIFAPDGYSTGAPLPPRDGFPATMLIVPRMTLDDAIRRRAVLSGARFEGGVLVDDVERPGDAVVVRGTRAGRPVSIRARAAVVATGASTGLLAKLGLLPKRPQLMLAARAYYEAPAVVTDRIQIRFDGVPLPGYGWVFPLSASSANVGVGYFPSALKARGRPAHSRAALEAFVRGRSMAGLLEGGRRTGPVRGYPLRVDFPEAPTSGDRVLLVGEAAGLVNPLTGEGIDYALESAQIAADHLSLALAGGPSSGIPAEYDRLLRARFGRLFTFCRRLRDATLSTLLLNRLVRVAARREDLKMLLVDIVLGNRDVTADVSVKKIVQHAFALIR
jgi:geranylgeranyl reductase family protein